MGNNLCCPGCGEKVVVDNRQTDRHRARQAQRRVVIWGCPIHRTPRGQKCVGCADQHELFVTSAVYKSAREKR
jgi:hypothetical protein